PGVGKSHLCEYFVQRLQPPPRLVRWQCSALHANTPFHPIIEEVERSAEIMRDDGAVERLAKLQTLFGRPSAEHDDLLPSFAALLSVPVQDPHPELRSDPREIRRKLVDALARRLILLSQRDPLILLIEDFHWSDPSTRHFVAIAADLVRSARVLI